MGRRLGEGRTIRLKDSSYFQWLQQWNLFGLPSAVAKIWLAQIVHQFMFPRWAKLKDLTKKSAALLIEILQVRFYYPSRDLFKEIMHRGPSMLLTEFAIDEEEAALDKMLKSLNFGDGTPESRTEALHKAMEQYEYSFASNFYVSAVGGTLFQLILVQVQQLKVGLLNALDSIDVLLQANKINVQLLAIVPAFVLLTAVTRLSLRALFNLRTRDIRPLGAVYSDMTEYLNSMEAQILVSGSDVEGETVVESLTPRQLGTIVFFMYRYLLLLDYSSPPFPGPQCDAIHRSLQEVLGPRGTIQKLKTAQQVSFLGHIKQKHLALRKNL